MREWSVRGERKRNAVEGERKESFTEILVSVMSTRIAKMDLLRVKIMSFGSNIQLRFVLGITRDLNPNNHKPTVLPSVTEEKV